MSLTRTLTVLVLGTTCIAVAGCGSTNPSAPSQSTTAVAPTVAHPADATQYLAAPCRLLNADQLAALDIHPRGTPSSGTDRPGTICTWIDDPTNNVLNTQWIVTYPHGLADLYQDRAKQAYFEETAVAGFPAVFTGPKDQRSLGECDLEVGTSDHDVLRVGFAAPRHPEVKACDLAKQAAETMIVTLTATR